MSACRIALAAVLLGVLGLVAPAPGAAHPEGPQGEGSSVSVQNGAPGPVRVYVLQTGHMVPIGTVQASADTTLIVPEAIVESGQDIQLIAERVGVAGGGYFRSEPLVIRNASRVELSISEDLESSRVSVED